MKKHERLPLKVLTGHIGRVIKRRFRASTIKKSFLYLRSIGCSRKQARDYMKESVT